MIQQKYELEEGRKEDVQEEKDVLIGIITSTKALERTVPLLEEFPLSKVDFVQDIVNWTVDYYRQYGKSPGSEMQVVFRDKTKAIKDKAKVALISGFLEELSREAERYPEEDITSERIFTTASGLIQQDVWEDCLRLRKRGKTRQADELAEEFRAKAKELKIEDEIVGMSADEIMKTKFEEIEWLWEGILARGSISLLVGKPKVGKSIFMFNLACCLAEGQNFLDIPIQKRYRVGYMGLGTQEKERRINQRLKLRKFSAGGDLVFFFGNLTNPIEQIKNFIQKNRLDVLFIDMLQLILPSVKDGNSYAQVNAAMAPLAKITEETGCALVLSHHSRKNFDPREAATDSTLGSQSYAGSVDLVMNLTEDKSTKARVFYVHEGRDNDEVPEITLHMDDKYVLTKGPELGVLKNQILWDRVEPALKNNPGVGLIELREICKMDRGALEEALRWAMKNGFIYAEGKGVKTDPYRYFVKIPKIGGIERKR